MDDYRTFLLGAEGLEARVPGRVAYTLLVGLGLAAAIDRYRAEGIRFDDDFERVVSDLVTVAEEFDRNRNGRLVGTSGSEAPALAAIVGDEMTVTDAAAVLRVSRRRVVRIAATELGGRKVKGRWLVSRAIVENEARRRGIA